MPELVQKKNQEKQQNYYFLLKQNLLKSQQFIDELSAVGSSKVDLQEYYVFFQLLALSADAYGLREVSRIASRMTEQLMQTKQGELSKSQILRLEHLHEKLTATLDHYLLSAHDNKRDKPVIYFYGLDKYEVNGVLNQVRRNEALHKTISSIEELSEFKQNDILIFRFTEQEIQAKEYELLFSSKKTYPNQFIYLAKEENPRLSLTLGAYGLESFFIWPEDQLFFARHFYTIYHHINRLAVPYRICFAGDREANQALNDLLISFGVEVVFCTEMEEVLDCAKQFKPDAFVLDDISLSYSSAPLVSAIRQISQLKLTPVFHLQPLSEEQARFNWGKQYEINVFLPMSEQAFVLGLEIFIRLKHERKMNSLTKSASEALQQESDWKAGSDLHNIMSITDMTGRIIEVNDNFCRVSGYSREELIGKNHRIINSGVHEKSFFQTMWQSISSGNIWQGEVCNRAKDGSLYWVESSVFPILDAAGLPEKYISIRTDVTHLKTIEERLLEVQSLAELGNWQADMLTGELDWSETIYEIFGFDKHNFTPSVEAFKAAIHPEDVEIVEQSEQRAKETGVHDIVHRIIRPDGDIRFVHELARGIYDTEGQLIRLAGSVQDVTEMKLVEEALKVSQNRLSMSLEFANIGTWDFNIEDGSLFWSEKVAPLFGGPESEMDTTYENFIAALHPDDCQSVLDAVNNCINDGTEYNIEHRVIWKDGSVRWLHEQGDVIRREDGSAIKMLGVVQDITERRLVQERLQKATARAEKSDKAKSEFLSSMSHELRTPLNAIMGFSQLLEVSVKEEQEQRYIENVLGSSQHLLSLINDILELSKVESGEMEFSLGPVSLSEVLQNTLTMTGIDANKNGVTLHAPEDLNLDSIYVVADFIRLKQVFINLISNAIKYNKPNGDIYIQLEVNEDKLIIHFKDTGIGVPQNLMNKLFVPFNRLNQENSSIEGTGIGLAITKRFMEAMNGTISVQSVLNEGSVFSIILPLAKNPESLGVNDLAGVTALKLLYIDQDLSNLRLMNGILNQIDSKVEFFAATSYATGISDAVRKKPDLIFMAINSSNSEVPSTLKALRNEASLKNVRIIGLIPENLQSNMDKLSLKNFDDSLKLPLTLDDVLAEVEHEKEKND